MKKILFVSTENGCNNRCVGCGDVPQKSRDGRATSQVIKDMKAGASCGYGRIHFAGGEITIQSNFFRLLDAAHALFSEIYLTTNGRMFSYGDFAQRVAQYPKIKTINVSLHGHTAKIHEAWTRTPGSFRQTVRGIRNILKHKKNVCANIIVWKGNYRYIPAYLRYVKKLGVRDVDIFNVAPVGAARKIYSSLAVCFSMLRLENDLTPFLGEFSSVEIEDFPRCLFTKSFRGQKNIHIYDTSGMIFQDRNGLIENYGLFAASDGGFSIESNVKLQKSAEKLKKYYGQYRGYVKTCAGCAERSACGGIFAGYRNIFGDDETNAEIARFRARNMG